MKFKFLETTDPYYNLALEEYLFRTAEEDIFLLWQNEPTIVIGKNQNAYAEIDHNYVKENNIKIARRITGGGAVYHDLGNVNFSYISTSRAENGIDFAYFTEPIIEALASLGVRCHLSGRNDILTSDGKKFSGNAQYSQGNKTLHHGTLLFDSDLAVLSSALRPQDEKLTTKAIKSTRSRVTNLRSLLKNDITTADFISLLSDFIIKKYAPKSFVTPSCDEVDKLCERNSSDSWIFPDRELLANYRVVKKKKYPTALLEIYLDMSNDKIRNIDIMGDFFGKCDIEELNQAICGATLGELCERIPENVGDYIHGIRKSELIELIRSTDD